MKSLSQSVLMSLLVALSIAGFGCTTQPANNTNSAVTTEPSPSSTVTAPTGQVSASVTLPVLNALFSDEAFKSELKSKVDLTDDQITSLQKSANDEIARLRQTNAEQQTGDPAEARERAAQTIRDAIGDEKAKALFALANEHWIRGSEELETAPAKPGEFAMLMGPNAVPSDSRIIVNIPAFRMDLFQDGSLVKSYKIGIGYPEFPLPTGLRKAQTIIFNPTWTPPDSPWVASMKEVTVGEKIEAGSKLNPLGPVKIPIGMPSLIHGGKSPAKLGNFASHGCVGLTDAQVKDFARLLAQTAGSEISDRAIESYLMDRTKTKVVKLKKIIPVELRYETIVVEDGKLHIYKDVYDENANTEENLRAVLEANGVKLEDLPEEQRVQILEALNTMSAHPKKLPLSKPANVNSPSPPSNQSAKTDQKKSQRQKKSGKNQKEVVIEIAVLTGKGYPAPVDLDSGTVTPNQRTDRTAINR